MKPPAGITLGIVSLVTFAAAAGHSPDLWERAANPALASADRVHEEVEVLLRLRTQRADRAMVQKNARDAMAKLEEIHADTSPDIRLRLDVGQVAETLEEWDRCDRALGGALAEAPDDPRAIAAYFSRGICLAKLGRPKEEIEAYDAYLARETDLDARAVAFYDRGDAQMLLAQDNPSRLALAINDYRTALLLRPELSSAHWGLAVALDRSGDAPGAIAAAKNALIFDPLEQQISPENRAVFFVPAYDQYWYEGLSAMARAQQPETRASPATSLLLLETAVAKWSNFIAAASRDDRWVPLAKSHLTSSQRQLDQARKRHTRSPNGRRPRADDVDP